MKDLHNEIMNSQVSFTKKNEAIRRFEQHQNPDKLYKEGHRDARHTSAELVMTTDEQIEDLKDILNKINSIIYAKGLSLGSDDYFNVRELCTEMGV